MTRRSLVSALVVSIAIAGLAYKPLRTSDAAGAASGETYRIDTVHSSLVFRVRFAGICDFWGRFNDFSGTYVVDEENPTNMKFEITAKAESVDTGNARRDGHLKSPDFFSAKEHPEMKFVSTSVKKIGTAEYEVAGDLTLRGVTKPVTAKVRYGGRTEGRQGARTGFDGSLSVQRTDFGVDFAQDRLGSEVVILMGLTGTQSD